MLRQTLALSLVVSCAFAAAVPFSAAAAPTRAPLAAQLADGPTLHPSGKDRYIEAGGSGTQGKAASDPDADYNYGVDQAGGDGGLYRSDRDGNNGCGNDQDFEDDNNGLCGRRVLECPASTTASYTLGFAAHGRPVLTLICTPASTTDSTSSGSPSPSPSTSTSTPIQVDSVTSPTS